MFDEIVSLPPIDEGRAFEVEQKLEGAPPTVFFDSIKSDVVRVRSVAYDGRQAGRVFVDFSDMRTFVFEIESQADLEKAIKRIVVDHIVDRVDHPIPLEFYVKIGKIYYTINHIKRELRARNRTIIYPTPPSLPPSERWPGARNTDEALPEFFRRVWGVYLSRQGRSFSLVRKTDKRLYTAISNWIHRDRKAWPSDLPLPPTQSAILAGNLETYFRAGARALSPKALAAVARKLERQQAKADAERGRLQNVTTPTPRRPHQEAHRAWVSDLPAPASQGERPHGIPPTKGWGSG
jgi:hypothetical protein